MQSWIFPMASGNKLLFVSLLLHLIVLGIGAGYLYKTRYILQRWYVRHVLGVTANEPGRKDRQPFYKMRLAAFQLLREQASLKKAILFVGDSLTNAFEWSEYFQNDGRTAVLNRGASGAGVEFLTEQFELVFSPGYEVQSVFIMIGINDIRKKAFNIEEFTRNYKYLIDKLLKYFDSEKIYIQSILPTRSSDSNDEVINNEVIEAVNEQIQMMAHSKDICYIDLFDKLADEHGYLSEKYALGGVHLSAQGYRVWMEHLRPYIANVPGFNSYGS
jgi:lysophospholipase L1-like esterase